MPTFPNDGNSEDWGYKFVGSAVDKFIRDVDGQAAYEAYTGDRRNRGEDLIFDLIGEEPCLFYVRSKGTGRFPGEEIWDLTIATDRHDVQLPAKIRDIGRTLGLRASVTQNGYGGLQIISTQLLQPTRGHIDGYAVPCRLRLLPNHRHRIGIPSAALVRMAAMPVCGNHVPTEDQLKAWNAFLQIEENIAKARQFCVPFSSHNYGSGTRKITFEIDVAKATLDGSPQNSLEWENFWERAKQAKNEEVKFCQTAPIGKNKGSSRQLGSIEEVDPNRCIIRVRLERDLADHMVAGRYQLPASGFLFFEAAGEITQIQRKKKALKDLNYGRTQNPFLGNFLFDASQARPIQETVQLQPEDLLLSSANPGQKAAVETVLAAQDLVLIQGPPGTGKTTVIAEICYQVALRGGRTLVASQANLAVDNVLSRLVHNPAIRAVRKGKAQKVGEEGQLFLEDNVVGTWLENTARDCEHNLIKRQENVRVLRQLLALRERFTAYLTAEEVFKQQQNRLETRKASLESTCTEQADKYNQALAQLGEMESLQAALEELLKKVLSVDWQDPDTPFLAEDYGLGSKGEEITSYILHREGSIVKLLDNLLSVSTDSSVRNFAVNVRLAIALASELGLVSPHLGSFGLAAWLQQTVHPWIAKVQTALGYANDTATAMTEAELAAQTCTQNSDSLVCLKSNHQQLLASRQELKQKIRNLSSHKSQISLAMRELETWLPTAHSCIFDTMAKCLQERQDFTVDLISLPSELLTLTMEAECIPWDESFDQCQFKVNQLIQKYREWGKVSSLARELKPLLMRGRNQLGTGYTSEADVSKMIDTLEIQDLDPVQSLKKLNQLAQRSIDEIQKPLGIWAWVKEAVLAAAVKWKILELIAKHLRRYSRRFTAAIALEAIRRQAQATIWKVQPSDSESALSEMTAEVVNGIVTSGRRWLNQRQSQTEQDKQRLEEQLSEHMRLEASVQTQISATEQQVEASRSQAEFKYKRAIALLQELSRSPQLPKELRIIVQQYLKNSANILADIPQFLAKVRDRESRTTQLATLISSIEPFSVLSTLKDQLISRISGVRKIIESYKNQLTESQSELGKIVAELQQQSDRITTERSWWQSAWEAIPEPLKPTTGLTPNLFDINLLHSVKAQFKSWQKQLQNEKIFLNRYQNFILDWIDKVRNLREGSRNDLKRIYLDNANVIGITCVQAASRDFSEEFKSFDIVIIDEVSKCTPPELLIPALKGKKLVMVGDHRQLPPMVDTNTLEEVAQEIGSRREELPFLEESLFKSQFEAAHESIKKMLNTQYRMHPIIMGAINQFYDGKLECGILEPDTKRAHHLAGKIIQEHHHLLWVKMTLGNEFEEQRQGTSLFNIPEIDVIERLCQQIESAWASRVANGEPKKQIAVITFYGVQLRKIDERLQSALFPSLQIRTGTVDRFQGMERPVVIVSMVRNNSNRDVGFAKKPERVNVAFSRAQELLIIVGCHNLFTQQAGKVGRMYSEVSNVVRRYGDFVDVSRVLC